MLIEERHKQILALLYEKGSITTAEIQRKFSVGYDTAKRDLRILEEQKQLKRTHGGALPLRAAAAGKPAGVTCRDYGEVRPNYLSIALHALSMLRSGDVVYISACTIGYFMAQRMPEDKNLRVVTNSVVMAEELRQKKNVSVLLLGGEMDAKGNCYDAFAIDMIRRLHFDACFITSAALSPAFGLSIQKSYHIPFLNAIMDSSDRVVGLYPTEKIGFASVLKIAAATRLHTLITDDNIADEDKAAFEDLGIAVVATEPESISDNQL